MPPVHDYVIDNSTGANVRADINNVLAAIVSNNSSSSEPSTKYAYQWWADTNAAVMKIRNSANDGWIELFQLDGTLTLEDGSVSAPALAARNDLNTGVFFSAADKFNVATGGVERMELGTTTIFNDGGNDVDFVIEGDSDTVLFYVDAGENRVGINESSPDRKLTIRDGTFPAVRLKNSSTSISNGTLIGGLEFSHLDSSSSGLAAGILAAMSNTSSGALDLVFKTGTGTSTYAETMRLTKDGHLLVGANADIHTGEGAEIQSVSTVGAGITLARNDTTVSNGSNLGIIRAYGNDADGTFQECGKIEFQADLNHGTNDKPTAIVFSTTPDGASSPTEKFRVKSGGDCELADGNLIVASGHGIDFSANGNASGMSSELLADYEEGTWTPDARDGSLTHDKAFYVKVGNMVTLHCRLSSFSDTSTNDQVTITGIPFAVGSTKADVAHGSAMYSNISETNNTTCLCGHARQGFNFFGGDSGAFSQVRHNELSSDSRIDFIATYFTF
tara:strand:+ start:52 stop:1560 length:1509 start_codon:yes stop_codon:yes gene_type:complete